MDLPRLKSSRTTRRRIISKLFDDLNAAILAIDRGAVESNLEIIKTKEIKLLEVNELLETATPVTELDAEIQDNEDYNNLIVLAKIQANRFLNGALRTNVTNPTNVATGTASTSNVNPPQNFYKSVNLPKLQINRFDGSVLTWPCFRDSFLSSIHSNPSLTNVDKFNYLKSLLKENASLTIAGLALTDANYNTAWTLLDSKYGDSQVLIAEHIKQLGELRAVVRVEHVSDIRRLVEEFEQHVRSLEVLGQDLSNMGAIVCPMLIRALPRRLTQDWYRLNKGKPVYDVKLLVDFVKQEIKCAELTYPSALTKSQSAQENNFNKKPQMSTASSSGQQNQQQSRYTSSSLVAAESSGSHDGNKQFIPYCVFCEISGNHVSRSCTKFASNRDRYQALRQSKRCTHCLKRNHVANACERVIFCKICKSPDHVALLCSKRAGTYYASVAVATSNSQRNYGGEGSRSTAPGNQTASRNSNNKAPHSSEENPTSVVASTSISGGNHNKMVSVLQTTRVWIKYGGERREIVILLDNGSQRSYIKSKLVDELNLQASGEESTVIRSFGGISTQYRSKILPVTLLGFNGAEVNITTLEVPEICHGVRVWENKEVERFLKNPKLQRWSQDMGPGDVTSVDVLIGVDQYFKIMTGREKRLSASLMAAHSVFGWMLVGCTPLYGTTSPDVAMCLSTEVLPEETLSDRVKAMWQLDSSGILSKEESSKQTLEEVEVLKQFEESTVEVNGRYQVRIPWNSKKEKLSSNYDGALERLRKLLWRLSKDKEFKLRYKTTLLEYLKNGHAEEVFEEEKPQFCFYMPHHAIIKDERKTTKTRIVFDASARPAGGFSLNDCQYTGANLNPLIFDLLTRFRWHKIAMVTDLSKAFLQVALHPEDQDACRFLWIDEPWPKGVVPRPRIFKMTRVLFGMSSSPFLLAATIRLHVRRYAANDPELIQLIDELTYVDDNASGEEETSQAYALSKKIYSTMTTAGMEFAKWATNCEELRRRWVTDCFLKVPEEPITEVTKVLGLNWDPLKDQLTLRSKDLLEASKSPSCTKRTVLEMLARVYDPLGFITPFVVILKKLLQDLWRLKIEWDSKMPENFLLTYIKWKEDLQFINEFTLPRWLNVSSLDNFQVHTFCDASPRIYAAVCYIRYFDVKNSNFKTCFIAAKSRLSPLNLVSIPRLELMACLIGSRLSSHIVGLLKNKPEHQFLWSDSKVALQWIKDVPSRWKLFVGRRVQEIQSLTADKCTWKYCCSKSNISDVLTRGMSLPKLLKNEDWWKGPRWLSESEEHWESAENRLEEKDLASISTEKLIAADVVQLIVNEEPLIDPSKFSTWHKLIRVTAWIIRFTKKARQQNAINTIWLNNAEIKKAEHYWFKTMQKQEFAQEFKLLTAGKQLDKTSSIVQFNPFLGTDGLIRLGGRLEYSAFSTNQKHPFLLRGGASVTLFILDRHDRILHGGVQATLARVRDEAWILRGRQSVRTALKNCMRCKRWNARPGGEVEAPLPFDRINEAVPFNFVGIDFAGPMDVKGPTGPVKAYICLFSCGITRAIHLELVQSLSSANFILAFRRFFARRGGCKVVFSDNAQTFKHTDRLLRESSAWLSQTATQDAIARLGIEWRFIAPRAAWWSGFYERMVALVKHHLRRTLGRSFLSPDEFYTILTEVEAVLNNRPLAPVSEDPNDDNYLTPSHFLLGRESTCLTDFLISPGDVPTNPQLHKRWKYRGQLLNRFWQQWRKNYLLQLRSAHEVKSKQNNLPLVRLNDVVLQMEDKLPRGRWKLCRVEELTPGRDGKVRSVMLRHADGSTVRRAIQHICPLEIA